MWKRLAVCGFLGALAVGGLMVRGPRRLRKHLAPRALVLASPEPQRNTEMNPIRKYHEVVRPRRLDAWTILGPGGGGTFHHPAISPFDPNLVFVSTDMTGCFVSEDGGLTWREFNLRMTCSFTFDPKRPETVYARAGAGGI